MDALVQKKAKKGGTSPTITVSNAETQVLFLSQPLVCATLSLPHAKQMKLVSRGGDAIHLIDQIELPKVEFLSFLKETFNGIMRFPYGHPTQTLGANKLFFINSLTCLDERGKPMQLRDLAIVQTCRHPQVIYRCLDGKIKCITIFQDYSGSMFNPEIKCEIHKHETISESEYASILLKGVMQSLPSEAHLQLTTKGVATRKELLEAIKSKVIRSEEDVERQDYLNALGLDECIVPDESLRLRALYFAIGADHLSAVQSLLAQGVDFEARFEGGESLLHLAIKNGSRQVSHYLAEQIKDSDLTDEVGRSPLHLAVIYQDAELVRKLVDRSSPQREDFAGATPLSYAVMGNQTKIIPLLLPCPVQDFPEGIVKEHLVRLLLMDPPFLKTLFDQGLVDCNAPIENGKTLLGEALSGATEETISELRQMGASDGLVDHEQGYNSAELILSQFGSSSLFQEMISSGYTVRDEVRLAASRLLLSKMQEGNFTKMRSIKGLNLLLEPKEEWVALLKKLWDEELVQPNILVDQRSTKKHLIELSELLDPDFRILLEYIKTDPKNYNKGKLVLQNFQISLKDKACWREFLLDLYEPSTPPIARWSTIQSMIEALEKRGVEPAIPQFLKPPLTYFRENRSLFFRLVCQEDFPIDPQSIEAKALLEVALLLEADDEFSKLATKLKKALLNRGIEFLIEERALSYFPDLAQVWMDKGESGFLLAAYERIPNLVGSPQLVKKVRELDAINPLSQAERLRCVKMGIPLDWPERMALLQMAATTHLTDTLGLLKKQGIEMSDEELAILGKLAQENKQSSLINELRTLGVIPTPEPLSPQEMNHTILSSMKSRTLVRSDLSYDLSVEGAMDELLTAVSRYEISNTTAILYDLKLSPDSEPAVQLLTAARNRGLQDLVRSLLLRGVPLPIEQLRFLYWSQLGDPAWKTVVEKIGKEIDPDPHSEEAKQIMNNCFNKQDFKRGLLLSSHGVRMDPRQRSYLKQLFYAPLGYLFDFNSYLSLLLQNLDEEESLHSDWCTDLLVRKLEGKDIDNSNWERLLASGATFNLSDQRISQAFHSLTISRVEDLVKLGFDVTPFLKHIEELIVKELKSSPLSSLSCLSLLEQLSRAGHQIPLPSQLEYISSDLIKNDFHKIGRWGGDRI